MTLKDSFYGGGSRTGTCGICGRPTRSIGKCGECASKIAAKINKEFQENIGHHMTEAICATGQRDFLDMLQKGQTQLAKLETETPLVQIEDKKNED